MVSKLNGKEIFKGILGSFSVSGDEGRE